MIRDFLLCTDTWYKQTTGPRPAPVPTQNNMSDRRTQSAGVTKAPAWIAYSCAVLKKLWGTRWDVGLVDWRVFELTAGIVLVATHPKEKPFRAAVLLRNANMNDNFHMTVVERPGEHEVHYPFFSAVYNHERCMRHRLACTSVWRGVDVPQCLWPFWHGAGVPFTYDHFERVDMSCARWYTDTYTEYVLQHIHGRMTKGASSDDDRYGWQAISAPETVPTDRRERDDEHERQHKRAVVFDVLFMEVPQNVLSEASFEDLARVLHLAVRFAVEHVPDTLGHGTFIASE